MKRLSSRITRRTAPKNGGWPRLAVVGAGAVGGYFGGLLAAAGAPVVMIGREPFVNAIKSAGLLLEMQHGHSRIHVEACTDIRAAGRADVILFSVKTSDAATA